MNRLQFLFEIASLRSNPGVKPASATGRFLGVSLSVMPLTALLDPQAVLQHTNHSDTWHIKISLSTSSGPGGASHDSFPVQCIPPLEMASENSYGFGTPIPWWSNAQECCLCMNAQRPLNVRVPESAHWEAVFCRGCIWRMYIYIYIYMCMHVYIYICVCLSIHIYTYIYILSAVDDLKRCFSKIKIIKSEIRSVCK